jgi:DNA-binding transcriptional ArsR family regulator
MICRINAPLKHVQMSAGEEKENTSMTTLQPTAWHMRDEEQHFPDSLLDLIAARFRLLGEPLRLKLLAALASGERNVSELVELTGAGQANISKHLAVLAQGGLVSRRKKGTSTYFTVADPTIIALCNAVCASVQEDFIAQAHSLGLNTIAGNVLEPLRPIQDQAKSNE